MDNPTLPMRPYYVHTLPAYTEEEVDYAFLACFASPAGIVVLDRLVVTYLLSIPTTERDQGKRDMILELLNMLQLARMRRENNENLDVRLPPGVLQPLSQP